MGILTILESGLWSGVAAKGYGALFNVLPRALSAIALLGLFGGATKF